MKTILIRFIRVLAFMAMPITLIINGLMLIISIPLWVVAGKTLKETCDGLYWHHHGFVFGGNTLFEFYIKDEEK